MTEPAEQSMPTPLPLTPQQQARRDNLLWAGLLVLLTLIVYQPAIRGAFLWDDDHHVSQNRFLQTADGLAKIWFHPSTTNRATGTGYVTPQYYPLTHTTFWVEYHLWGLNVVGYHLVNILLHAGSALLLWRLLRLMRVPGAWLAAAVFAVHPIEVESVAWISERKNVLACLFFLGSVYAYLRFAGVSEPCEEGEVKRREIHPAVLYGVSFLLFACAVFSKTVASVMPAVMVLLLWWQLPGGGVRRSGGWKVYAGLIPFLILGFVVGRQTAWMEVHVVGAAGPEWDFSFAQRVVAAGHAFWFYLGKLAWPVPLIFIYNTPAPDPSRGGQWFGAVAALVVLLAAAVWLLVGRRFRGAAVAALAYGVMLFPAMGFFNVYPMRYSLVADHFQYLAGIAVISLVVGVVTSLVWRGELGRGATAARVVAGVVLLLLAGLAWRQSGAYASDLALWQDTVAKNPDAWMAHYNLGSDLTRRAMEERAGGDAESAAKDFADAMSHYQSCIALRPGHAKAYANWGIALYETGQYAAALDKLNAAIELDPAQSETHFALGRLYQRTGKMADAEAEYRKAATLDPRAWRAHLAIGQLLGMRNDLAGAEGALREAERIHPEDLDVQYALAVTLDMAHKFKEALPHAMRAAAIQPENPKVLTTLGYLFGENGLPNESFDAFRRALVIDPNNKGAMAGAKLLIDTVAAQKRAATRATTTRSTTTRSVAAATVPTTGAAR